MGTPPARVAVVGSGVAGLTAAYVASRTAHVTLFEADDRLGGHADTHRVVEGRPRRPRARHRHRLHRAQPAHLPGAPPDVRRARRRDPAVGDVDVDPRRRHRPRVGRGARSPGPVPDRRQPAQPALPGDAHRDPAVPPPGPGNAGDLGVRTCTLRAFLEQGRFSAYFVRHFMEPLVAAVWSCDPEVALDYPARYLFTFLEHHGMLGVFGSPQWRTVTGGSQAYVAKVAAALPARSAPAPRSPRSLETADRGRGHRRQRRGHDVRRGRDRHAPGTGPGDAGRADRAPARAPRRRCRTRPTPRCCTPTRRVMPRAEGAWASWNFLRRASTSRLGRRRHRHLRPHPAAAPRHRRRTTSSRSAARTWSTPPP